MSDVGDPHDVADRRFGWTYTRMRLAYRSTVRPRDDSAYQIIDCGNVANNSAAMKRNMTVLAE